MNKILPFLVVGILVFSGLGTIAIPCDKSETIRIIKSLTFQGQPKVEVKDDFLKIEYDGATTKLMVPGEPELPIYIETFILPKEAKNIKVICTIKDIDTMKISGQIAPSAVYPTNCEIEDYLPLEKDEKTYRSNEFYPSTWFSYYIGHGLNGKEHVIFVKVVLNVVRYAPSLNKLEYLKRADITLTYNDSDSISTEPDIYDMVIISPEMFVDEFQPLVDHKNSYGINTTIKTVEEILVEFDGFDVPEKIKYFIKYAIEEWGITYALLGGGLRSHLFANDRDDHNQGTKDWHVPVRYTNIIKGTGMWRWWDDSDHGCISDLYYADIYTGDGDFSSWDSNGDGIYAAWDKDGVMDDVLDLYPDIYVARLPCRNEREVKFLVNKIIVYESTYPTSKPWFKKMIAIAGCTRRIYEGQPDGEFVCDISLDYMNDLIKEPVRVYSSNRKTGGPTPIPKDIIDTLYGGASFVIFRGHGTPYSWDTHWDDGENWTGGFDIFKFWRLFNGNKLPVIVVGGCHCGLFNVTIEKTIRSGFEKIQYRLWVLKEHELYITFLGRILDHLLIPYNSYRTYGIPTPICFSWGLCLVPWGGAIATTGCTGYGFGNFFNPLSLSSELETNFFYEVGQQNVGILSQAHGGSITKFLNENYIGKTEAHCITVYHAFGDPSLKLGGYL